MTREELEKALKGATVEIREAVAREVASAKADARLTAVIGAASTVLAAAISALVAYLVATTELEKIAKQASADMTRSAHQKLFEQVFDQRDRFRLRDSFALLIIGNLVDEPFRAGICAVIEASFDEIKLPCEMAAQQVLRPAAQEAAKVQEAIADVTSTGGDLSVKIPSNLTQAIMDLGNVASGEEGRTTRLAAAQMLLSHLNDTKAELRARLATFAALVRTTAQPVYGQLNLNARFNTFVVLSGIEPLRDTARADPSFQQLARSLVENANVILTDAATRPDLAGERTQEQIRKTLDVLKEFHP